MAQLSQSSVVSNASTIPPDILLSQDDEFIEEVELVNNLYFGNIQLHDSLCETETDRNSDENSDSDSVHDSASGYIPADFSDVDRDEQAAQNNFKGKTCGCVRLYGKPCSTIVDWETLIDYRSHCLETPRTELDTMVKVQLYHHRKNDTVTDSKKHRGKERERPRQEYYFQGHQVCRNVFAFAHGVNRKTVDSIARSLDSDGLIPRKHGNTGKSPKHALTLMDVLTVKQFLLSYGNKYGLPLPGRLPNFRDNKAVLLPSDKTKADIHQEYLKAAEDMQYRKICLSEFKTIWLEQCPHLLIIKPATDLCHKCQMYVNLISKSGNLTEEEKTEKLKNYQDHLEKAKVQRDHYRDQCQEAKTVFSMLSEENKQRGKPPCSVAGMQHYSFDYAQQVHYPHYAQQVGPLFFKTPRKCQCFGVCAEGSGSQIFYLVDESQHSGKGANTVASLLHHHFENKGYGETDVRLHMDNCVGQNKNNTVIGYGLWRTMTLRHHTVEFSLMEAGHTKFHPDWHFGLWKVRWRGSTVETMTEMAESVSKSSRSGHNIPQLVDDQECPVHFYDWSTYFKKFFKPIPHLTTYHHFRMDSAHPGIIYLRRNATDNEETVNVLKNPNHRFQRRCSELPEIIPNKGLDPQRQWYLYEEVAPYCANTVSCPRPLCAKPVIKLEAVPGSETESKRKCSHCKKLGHNKSKSGKILCPELLEK